MDESRSTRRRDAGAAVLAATHFHSIKHSTPFPTAHSTGSTWSSAQHGTYDNYSYSTEQGRYDYYNNGEVKDTKDFFVCFTFAASMKLVETGSH